MSDDRYTLVYVNTYHWEFAQAVCNDCGSVVYDTNKHDEWHATQVNHNPGPPIPVGMRRGRE